MRKTPLLLHITWLCLCITGLVACSAQITSISTPELTQTATPITPSPTPSGFDSNIILYRGDSQRTGVYNILAIRNQPEVKWQTEVSSSWLMPPMIADGMLYTGSGDGILYALNAETGEEAWSVGGFEAFESTGAIAGDLLVTGGFSNVVKALDKNTGDEVWSYQTDYFPQGSPLIVNERVYIATDHAVYTLDLQSGQLIWEVATGNESAFMGAPAFDEGVIYTTGGKLLLALDAASGDELWRVEKDEIFLGLAVANGMIYVGNWDHHFYAFDQLTGEEQWSFEAGGEFWSAPAVNGDVVYAGNIDHFLYALHPQTGELLWQFDTGGDAVSEALISDGVLYVSDSSHLFPSGPRHLYALDAVTGEELWVFESVSTFMPAPALGDGVIYVTSTGEVIALK